MHPRLRRVSMAGPALATLILLVSCSGHAGSTTTSAEITTTGPHPATTTAATTSSTTLARDESVTVHLAPFSAMLPGWTEQVFLYGEGEEFLGNSPGGEGLMLGPEYGTQTPDGTWWFLDAANLRIAHFAEDGTYLSQVVMPEDLLVDGQFFQYQMPQALDDGSIAAGSFRGEETMALLRIVDGGVSGVTFDGAVPWVTTDGAYLYGLSIVDGLPNRLDPNNPAAEEVDWFGARDGSRYLVTVNEDEVLVELPDATTPLTRTLQMRFSEDPEVIARAGIEWKPVPTARFSSSSTGRRCRTRRWISEDWSRSAPMGWSVRPSRLRVRSACQTREARPISVSGPAPRPLG